MASASSTAPLPLPLDGRVALVTGGSRGIGREVSSHLAALGARVVVNYASNPAKADELVAELASRGLRAVAVRADVSDPDAVRALFDRAEEAFGSPPHVVVACAGILDPKYPALADTAVEDFDAAFAGNTRGKFLVCREAARRIPPHSGGRIVAFSSTTVAALPPGYGAYRVRGEQRRRGGHDEDPRQGGGAGARAHRAVPGGQGRGLHREGGEEFHGAHRRDDGHRARGGVPGERCLVLGERPGNQGQRRRRVSASCQAFNSDVLCLGCGKEFPRILACSLYELKETICNVALYFFWVLGTSIL